MYDFRDRRVVGEDGAQQMESLSGEAAARLLRLVHYWERMMLARGNARELREN